MHLAVCLLGLPTRIGRTKQWLTEHIKGIAIDNKTIFAYSYSSFLYSYKCSYDYNIQTNQHYN